MVKEANWQQFCGDRTRKTKKISKKLKTSFKVPTSQMAPQTIQKQA